MKKITLLSLILLCIILPLHAQNTTSGDKSFDLSGVIYDDFDVVLPGVSIFLKDRPGVGVVSDTDGKFTLKVQKGDMLVISFVGFKKYEHLVNGTEKNLTIKLEPQTEMLEETVVVGLGTQRKVSVVGAITSVNVEELQQPATSINNMIGGRIPGIISIQSSGEPGKNISDFWIRGIGTFGVNSGALVLIDGLEGKLNEIDPADIESFSVLKDASATAIYGVRGANGVLLITTKRGENEKLKITARANLTVSYLKRMPEYLDAYNYALMANEATTVSGMTQKFSDMELDLIKYGLDPDLYPNVNWQKEILNRTSLQQTYYTSAQGGGSIARYFISLGMSLESAAYKQDKGSKYNTNVGYDTYNYRTNLDVNVTKTTSVYFGVNGYISKNNMPGMANTNWLWSSQAKLTPLTVPTQYSNGALPAYGKDDQISPYVLLNHTGMATEGNYKAMATLAINQDLNFLTPGLTARIQGAFDNRNTFFESRQKMPDLYSAAGRATDGELILIKRINSYPVNYSKTQSQWRKYHFEATVNYDRLFGTDHRIGGLLYYYMSSEESSDFTTSMTAIPKRYQGLSGRLTYGYKDTYFLDANFGYTGSENFKKGEQFGFFPSIAIGWVPTAYPVMQEKLPWLNFLKIRASHGTAGNDRIADDRFPYLTILSANAAAAWGDYGITETVVGADNLAWEKAIKTDIGLEARMLDERLSFVVDIFNDKRDGIFQSRTQLPDYVGAVKLPYGNVGSMRSYGSDGNISFTQNFGKNNSFTIRGNFTYATNEVKKWEQPTQKYDYQLYEGKPLNVLRGYISTGLFRDEADVNSSPKQFGTVRPGDIKYKDVNGDGVINTEDQVPISYSPMPRLMYGFGGELKIKDFTFNVLFRGTGKTNFFYGGNGYIPFYGGETGNVLSIAADQRNRWTPASYSGDPSTERQDVRFPRLSYGYNENNSQPSSFWLADGRYLRLQELSVSYNLRTKALKQYLGVSSLDIQLIGYNLCVWDKVKLWDPEIASENGTEYPIPARFALQLYVNF